MRLTVRDEQIAVLEELASERFVRKIAAELNANYADDPVKLPSGESMTVSALPPDKLDSLIKVGIGKAKRYEMKAESAIAGFVFVMFDVSPNFDQHRLSQVLLNDEETAPDQRMTELLGVLSDDNWESIRKDYDPLAWEPEPEPEAESEESVEQPEPAANGATDVEKTPRPEPAKQPGPELDPNMQATILVDFKN